MNAPCKEKIFKLRLTVTHYKKGQIIECYTGDKLLILKSCPYNWWRKFLRFIGFKVSTFHYYKAKVI